jgi:hypothetical protein
VAVWQSDARSAQESKSGRDIEAGRIRARLPRADSAGRTRRARWQSGEGYFITIKHFAKGNNDAIKIALKLGYDYIILFNMDTAAEKDCLSKMIAATSDEKVAASMDKRTAVYDETFRRAEDSLKNNDGVILDATFVTQSLRRRAAEIAAKHNLKIVELPVHYVERAAGKTKMTKRFRNGLIMLKMCWVAFRKLKMA